MVLAFDVNGMNNTVSVGFIQEQEAYLAVQNDIIFVQSSNNTWLSDNLTSRYPWNVNMILARSQGESVIVSLVHETNHQTVSVDWNDFQVILKNFIFLSLIIEKK